MCACLFELFFLCFVIVSLCAFAFYVPTLAFFPPPKHLSFFVHLLCLLLHSTYNYIIAFVVCTFFLCCFYITTSIFFFNFFFKSLYIYFKLFLFHVCKYCVVSFFFVYFIMYRCGFKSYIFKYFVVTLALNLWPKQGFAKVRAKRETWESHLVLPGVQKSVREWTLTLPSEPPFWELESQWTFESSKGDCKGQNLLDWKKIYIIENLLKLRCLKWACMTHLDIWNISYGQKKGRESNWQFDFWSLKVENRPDFLMFSWCATYRWKALDKRYNFALNLIIMGGMHKKLWGPKIAIIPILKILGPHLEVPGQNAIWMWVWWRGT
jgi:hypothetical protein